MAYNFSILQQKLKEIEEWLAKEFGVIRTSRATPTVLDSVHVESYGSRTPLRQVANVTTEDARSLRVSPWDASLTKEIEKAITQANLGLAVSSDDRGVRVTFPELTAERRTALVKLAKQKLEEGRISVRKVRDEIWRDIEAKEKQGGMSEDDKFRLKDQLQKHVDGLNKKLEEATQKKEKEISG